MGDTYQKNNLNWPLKIYENLKNNHVKQIAYVPDTGHKNLIEYCHNDRTMKTISLTTEEEGMGLLAGAWLGGEKGVLFASVILFSALTNGNSVKSAIY